MSKRTLYAFIVSFILLISVIILNRFSSAKMKEYTEAVNHTREVITSLEQFASHFKSAQIFSPIIMDTITEKKYYTLYKNESEHLSKEVEGMKFLVRDNTQQAELVDSINVLLLTQINALMEMNIAEIIRKGEQWRLNELYKINVLINKGVDNEKALLINRTAELNSSTRLNNLWSVIFAIVAIGILMLVFIYNVFIARSRSWLEGFLGSIVDTTQNGIIHNKAVWKNGEVLDFKIAYINPAVRDLFGNDADNLIGKSILELMRETPDPGMMDRYRKVMITGQPTHFEFAFNNNGKQHWFLASLAKTKDGVTSVFQEITQLKIYESELKTKITELERSNAELEQYAYVASHDLQEPLRKIRSFGSFLKDTQADRLDEKGKMQLDKILSSAERMSILIKDILSFSGLKTQDRFEPTDLNKTLHSVLTDLELLITQKNARIESEPLPVIDGIPLQMHQLFYNLINNSIKFSKPGLPPFIRISCHKLENTNPQQYEIRLKDNGIGFSQEYAEQIFGLFKRLNEKHTYPGSGIGLALCKKVVENHHGSLQARSSENQGAEFIICLPEKQQAG